MSPSLTVPHLKATIRQGSVYYFRHRSILSETPHFFVVVNASPVTDECIVFLCCSSQVENTKNILDRKPGSTYLLVKAGEYSEFTKDTIIDCNQYFKMTSNELLEQVNSGFERKVFRNDFSRSLIDALVEKVKKSDRIPEMIKRLL